jgi:hypothetical protein
MTDNLRDDLADAATATSPKSTVTDDEIAAALVIPGTIFDPFAADVVPLEADEALHLVPVVRALLDRQAAAHAAEMATMVTTAYHDHIVQLAVNERVRAVDAALENAAVAIEAVKSTVSRDSFYREDDGHDAGYFDYLGGLDDAATTVRSLKGAGA